MTDPTRSASIHLETETQLLATCDLLDQAARDIRRAMEAPGDYPLWGVVVALEDRSCVLRELHGRFAEGAQSL